MPTKELRHLDLRVKECGMFEQKLMEPGPVLRNV